MYGCSLPPRLSVAKADCLHLATSSPDFPPATSGHGTEGGGAGRARPPQEAASRTGRGSEDDATEGVRGRRRGTAGNYEAVLNATRIAAPFAGAGAHSLQYFTNIAQVWT